MLLRRYEVKVISHVCLCAVIPLYGARHSPPCHGVISICLDGQLILKDPSRFEDPDDEHPDDGEEVAEEGDHRNASDSQHSAADAD